MKFLIECGYRRKSELIDFQSRIRIPQSGIRSLEKSFTSVEKIGEALKVVKKDKVRTTLIKLMAYSGLRLSNSVWMLNNFEEEKLEFKEKFVRYSFNLPYRTKRVFFAYMPTEFGRKLEKFSIVEGTYRSYGLADSIVLPNQLRKWNAMFLRKNGVPDDVIDFIQGRTPSRTLQRNYLNLVELADEWYSRIVDKLTQLIPP